MDDIFEQNKTTANKHRQVYNSYGDKIELRNSIKARYRRFKEGKVEINKAIYNGSLLPFEGAIFEILEENDNMEAEIKELKQQRDFYKIRYGEVLTAM